MIALSHFSTIQHTSYIPSLIGHHLVVPTNNFLSFQLMLIKNHGPHSPITSYIFPKKTSTKMSTTSSLGYGGPTSFNVHHTKKKNQLQQPTMKNLIAKAKQHNTLVVMMGGRERQGFGNTAKRVVRCSGIGIGDFIGGDLVRFDIGKWLSDVEEHKALAIYPPHEGGYEGRYLSRLKRQGYYFLDLSARGLGDPETTLTKIHPVCPAHVGKQPIARWYYPPEVDYRLEALPPNAKGLVVWIIEAKVLSKAELQFLALLPTLRPNVRVVAECGNWRKFMWKPLKDIAGLTTSDEA